MYGRLVSHESVARLQALDYFVNPAYYEVEGREEAQAKYAEELFSGIWKFYFFLGEEREWLPELLEKRTLFINLTDFIWNAEPGSKSHPFYVSYVGITVTAIVAEPLLQAVEKALQIGKNHIDIYTVKDLVCAVADATHLALEKWNKDIQQQLTVRWLPLDKA